MLTCLHAPFVPPRRLIIAVPKAVTVTPEHSLPSLPFNRSHRIDRLALGGDHLLTSMVQRSSTKTIFCYAHLRRNRFQVHVPPPQRLTTTAPLSEVMAGTRKRTAASRSSTSQAPRSMIQVLEGQTVPILEPVNSEEGDAILDTTTGIHTTTALNTPALPPPPPHLEDIPPPSPSPRTSPPPKTNEVLANLVN